MISQEIVMAELVRPLAALPFFPTDESARGAIGADVLSYVSSEEQLRRLRLLIFTFWKKWESPAELRAAFCALYPPKDGRMAYSALYPEEGYPPLNPHLAKLGMNLKAIDAMPPSAKQIAQWERECGSPQPAALAPIRETLSLVGQKLLAAPAEPITAEEVSESVYRIDRQRREALESLSRATRYAANRHSRAPSAEDVELDRKAVRELYGTAGVSLDQAREAVRGLADLEGYTAELEEALTQDVYRRAPDFDRALAAVGQMRRNWRYLLQAVGIS